MTGFDFDLGKTQPPGCPPVGTKNKTTDPPVLCYYIPLTACPCCMVYSPLFLRYQRTACCYYCCYHDLPPVDIIFSCPDTITLITVTKTLTVANLRCFPWTSQSNNYRPNKKCPSDSPPPESFWVCDSPLFSSLQPQIWESVLQWVPKTRVMPPPPPPPGPWNLSYQVRVQVPWGSWVGGGGGMFLGVRTQPCFWPSFWVALLLGDHENP